MRISIREIGAFALWLPVAVAFTMLYLLFIRHILGVRMGLEGVGYVVTLPGGFLFFATVIWLPFFIWRRRSLGRRMGAAGAAAGAGLAAVALLPLCGLACFGGQPTEYYLGEAAMLFAFAAAWGHDRLSRAFLTSRGTAA